MNGIPNLINESLCFQLFCNDRFLQTVVDGLINILKIFTLKAKTIDESQQHQNKSWDSEN